MAQNTFSYFYDFLGLSDLKVNYDFSGSSGGFIPSVSPAQPTHSGELNSVGLVNQSGLFSNSSSIRISNIDSSFDALGTHIFNFERTGNLGSGLLFSSLRTGTLNSGYNIGLTDSNLLFFEYIGANGPVLVNSDIILGDKNAAAVLIGNNSVTFNLYNFNTKAFETNTRSIASNELLFSDQWYLRGAENTLGNYLYFNKNVTTSNLTRLFSGFYATPTGFPAVSGSEIYFEQIGFNPPTGNPLESNSYSISFSGFDSEFFQLLNGQFGDPVIWGEINNAFLVSGSGISGVSSLPSGSYGVVLTGSTGDFIGDYYPFYYGSIENTQIYSGGANYPYEGEVSGVFVLFDSSISLCPTNPVFNISLGSSGGGAISLSPIIVEKTGYYLISPPYSGYIIDSGVVSSYGMGQVSYLWQKNCNFLDDLSAYPDPSFIVGDSEFYLASGGNIYPQENIPTGSYALAGTGSTGAFTGDYFPFYFTLFSTVYLYSGGEANLYNGDITSVLNLFEQNGLVCELGESLNGNTPVQIYTFTGGISTPFNNKTAVFDLVKGEYSAGGFYPSGNSNWFLNGLFQVESGFTVGGNVFNPTYTKITDYFSDNQYFNTNGFALSTDLSVYDYNQQQNRVILPNSYSGNSLISGAAYNLNNKSVYLNGQRLVSGVDYLYNGTIFSGLTEITGISGVLTFVNNYTGEYLYADGYNYTGLTLPRFSRGSTIYYLNGIRINESLFVEHSRFDHIAGNYIFDESSEFLINDLSLTP